IGHIFRGGTMPGESIREVAERLRKLGWKVLPDAPALPADINATDLKLTSRNFDGKRPWLRDSEQVPASHLIRAARRRGWSVPQVTVRAESLGMAAPDITALPDRVTRAHMRLISRDLNGKRPWLGRGKPVGAGHIIGAAGKLRLSPAEV